MNGVTDVHLYNNQDFMTEYHKKTTWIKDSISDDVLLWRKKIHLQLNQIDGSEEIIFDFQEIFFLPSSLLNLVSFALLNNHGIFYGNENKTLYNVHSKEVLA